MAVVAPTHSSVAADRWRLVTMLPVRVALGDGVTYRLAYRRVHDTTCCGTVFELQEDGRERTLWSAVFSGGRDWLRMWSDGVKVPRRSVAERVFQALRERHLAERMP